MNYTTVVLGEILVQTFGSLAAVSGIKVHNLHNLYKKQLQMTPCLGSCIVNNILPFNMTIILM